MAMGGHGVMVTMMMMMMMMAAVDVGVEMLAAAAAAASDDPNCMNRCGSTAVMYPLGTGAGCGSAELQSYVKCSKGKMMVYTSTGRYEVVQVDYGSKVIIVMDPAMSTCSVMQRTHSGFGLQAGAPLAMTQGGNILLLGCTAQTDRTEKCDPAGDQTCGYLYRSCPAVANLGLSTSAKSAAATCCLYKAAANQSQGTGFIISPDDLNCASYTSVYSFGAGAPTYGDAYTHANTWSYGIPLRYTLSQPPPAGCPDCESSNGSCATASGSTFLCVCPSGIHTTSICPGTV